jgi:uncharacterized phage protein (TIGR01671 family)
MKNLEQKEGFFNRHINPLPKHKAVIKIITKGHNGQFNFVCNWKPFEEIKSEGLSIKTGYLGTATPNLIQDGEYFCFHAWEQNDEEFVYYSILENIAEFEAESRIIKFRAWDNKEKKWLLGYNYPNLGGFSLTGEVVLFGEWGSVFDTFLFNKDGKKWEDLKIMQYSGLLDKNQKPIYEGDIVTDESKGNGVVVFKIGCFFINYGVDGIMEFLGLKLDSFGRGKRKAKRIVEVVGNIYENPQLIETINRNNII